ncbi:hypothetical protein E8P77_10775 [Soehngenia saccharolytica]|nr:hypothetical protein E8P77_10775 [Soehngenia saccharolytica]
MKNQVEQRTIKYLLDFLNNNNIDYVDNRETSSIIWVIDKDVYRNDLIDILNNLNYSYSFEKRGSLATKNKPSLMIIVK